MMNQALPETDQDQASRIIPVDVEHAGVRLALPLILLASFVILFVILNALPGVSGTGCLMLLIAGGGALLMGIIADRVLKRIWPSGRSLVIHPDGLRLLDRRKRQHKEINIQWAQRINLLAWRFTVKRGSARIPKGWIMLGCQLTQDDEQVILYTLAPDHEAEDTRYANFNQLLLREVVNKGELPLREANKQRRLLRVEDERWRDGAELAHADFATLIDTLMEHDPLWQE
jgi:hypothetical protein